MTHTVPIEVGGQSITITSRSREPDRYPDILGLHAGPPGAWSTIRTRLADLPAAGVRLGADVGANRATVTAIVAQVLARP